MNASDWNAPNRHRSRLSAAGPRLSRIARSIDGTRCVCFIHLGEGASVRREEEHVFHIRTTPGSPRLGLVIEFSLSVDPAAALESREVEAASAGHWRRYWQEGWCLELAGSRDVRVVELERRIVLAQYLAAIQSAGSLPPQETGLTCSSWYGKFHLEMHYGHAAHFPLWGRAPLLERSLGW